MIFLPLPNLFQHIFHRNSRMINSRRWLTWNLWKHYRSHSLIRDSFLFIKALTIVLVFNSASSRQKNAVLLMLFLSTRWLHMLLITFLPELAKCHLHSIPLMLSCLLHLRSWLTLNEGGLILLEYVWIGDDAS